MKNNWWLFERPFKEKKNGIFFFETVSVYIKTNPKIKNISESTGGILFKLGTSKVCQVTMATCLAPAPICYEQNDGPP